jgi:hypothetical protein
MNTFGRLSRIKFIAGGGGLLAGCSVGGSPLFGGPKQSESSKSQLMSEASLANSSHKSFRLSTSPAGNSIAMHAASDGAFIGSVAVRSHFVRYTWGNTKSVVALRPPTRGFHHLKDGAKFKFARTKGGKPALVAVDANQNKFLVFRTKDGYLNFQDVNKNILGVETYSHAAVPATAAPGVKFLSLIDEPGTWHGDDDFYGNGPLPRTTSSSARALMDCGDGGDYYGDSGDCGDRGDGDSGDSGDGVVVGDAGGEQYGCWLQQASIYGNTGIRSCAPIGGGGGGSGSDSVDFGDGATDGGPDGGTGGGGDGQSAACQSLATALGVAFIAVQITGILWVAACITPAVVVAAPCAFESAALAAALYTYFTDNQNYDNQGCPA